MPEFHLCFCLPEEGSVDKTAFIFDNGATPNELRDVWRQ
jgi:hypothetical protein